MLDVLSLCFVAFNSMACFYLSIKDKYKPTPEFNG